MSTTTARVDTIDLTGVGTTDATVTGTAGTQPAGPAAPVTTPSRTVATAYHRLVAALRAALEACAELDPDALGSRTAGGRAAVPMAGTARSAIAALGGDPGMALTHAPGIVVGRDLAFATARLTATPEPGEPTESLGQRLADLAAEAERRLAELLRAVTGRA